MQTFLPWPQFERSAAALDVRRLGKQRVEALQVGRALVREGYGWRHHPVVRMWRGHHDALAAYTHEICAEWRRRGHADTCEVKLLDELGVSPLPQEALAAAGLLPPWLGDESLHRSHRSALVRKDPAWYRPQFGDVPDDLPYVWPDEPARPVALDRAVRPQGVES